MNIYISARQGGKTSTAIRKWLDDPEHTWFMVPNERMAEDIRNQVKGKVPDTLLKNIRPWLDAPLVGNGKTKIIVDNADWFVQERFRHHKVEFVTWTVGDG